MPTALLLGIVACDAPRLERYGNAPALLPLEVTTVIGGTDSFAPSAVAGTHACEILLVGARWGSIVRIRADGAVDSRIGRVPGARQSSRLEGGGGTRLLLWSHKPAFWGVLDSRDLSVDSLPVPRHAWGMHWVGPPALLASGGYAMAPIGDRAVTRRQPEPWVPAPLVQVLGPDGRVTGALGQVTNRGGHYLSWLGSRLALGSVGDTVLALTLSDAVLSAYLPSRAGGPPSLLWKTQLPLYFHAPPAREEVRTYPWIQIDGDLIDLIQVSHVADATFGPEGKVYAIRNYMAEWRDRPNRVFKAQGSWQVSEQGLEIYDRRGTLLGAYALPGADVSWLRVDAHGRLFLREGPSSVIIARDPTSRAPTCPSLPTQMAIPVADAPPTTASVATTVTGS